MRDDGKKLNDLSAQGLSIQKNIAWNTAGNLFYLVTQWLLTYFVVIILGFEDAGVLSLATTIAGALIGVANYSMRSFQVSDINDEYSDGTYIVSRIITSAISLLICVVFLLWNGYSSAVSWCIVVYMVFKVSEAVSDVYQGILQKRMRMDYIGKSFLIKGFVTLVAFLGAIVLTKSLLWGIVALAVFSSAIVFVYDRRKAFSYLSRQWACKKELIVPLLIECLPLAVFGLLFNFASLAPRYFLEAQMGAEALGYYASVAMPVVIVQVSASYVFAPLTTPFALLLDKGDQVGFKSLLKKIILFVFALSTAALVLFWLFGDWALVLAFGQAIAPYSYLLMPLVVCTIFVAVCWFLSTLLIVMRQLKGVLVASAIAFLIVVFGSNACISYFGMNGTSFILIAALAANAIVASAFLYVSGRKAFSEREF